MAANAMAAFAVEDRSTRSAGGVAGFAVVEPDEIGAIATEWTRRAGGNVFFGADFAIPAINHFGGGRVSIATVRDDSSRLLAIAPFTRARLGRVAPAVSLWAHKYAPLGAPLLDPGDPAFAVDALIAGLAPDNSGLSLIMPDMPVDGVAADAVRAFAADSGRPLAVLDDHERAILTRGPVEADPRANLSKKQRRELARQMRRMADLGDLKVETETVANCVLARFEEFLALEMAGWKGERGTALASSPDSVAFAREAMFNLAASGNARVHSLRIGDHPVAILVSLVAGVTAYTWKIAYDEAYGRFSPGAQIMLEAPAHLFSDPAVTRIDSCASADHPMIDRLWPERMRIATFVLGPPGGGAIHAVGVAAARAEIAARAQVRQLISRH